ncbi:hypothetical protein AcW1_009505 [Taiwanofungus camphoratus]|nr:hypothetical protein AcV7_006902 [Antrodia cinnamomea]KAI0947852.1 hypothetical protein AcW1_009505 [Antrodia cinnamomea]
MTNDQVPQPESYGHTTRSRALRDNFKQRSTSTTTVMIPEYCFNLFVDSNVFTSLLIMFLRPGRPGCIASVEQHSDDTPSTYRINHDGKPGPGSATCSFSR